MGLYGPGSELRYLYSIESDTVIYEFLLARKGPGYGIIKEGGEVILPFKFPKLRWLSDDYFMEDSWDHCLVINMQGDTVFDSGEIWIWHQSDSSEKEYFAKKGGKKYGIYNIEERKWVLEPVYEDLMGRKVTVKKN